MDDVYIFDAVRTPRGKGKKSGTLADVAPHALVAQLIDELADRSGRETLEQVSRLTLGCVGQINAQGGHLALVSKLASSLPNTTAVHTLNNYCVSGLTALSDAIYRTRGGEPGLKLAGGVECLSQVGFFEDKADYYTDPTLMGALKWVPPVLGADLLANVEGYTKEELDDLTLTSHKKAGTAWAAGHYESSVMPVRSGSGETLLAQDEYTIRQPDEKVLLKAPPVFKPEQRAGFDKMMLKERPELEEVKPLHTIAHCPGPADGAALALIGSEKAGAAAGLSPKARVLSYAEMGGDPVLQLTACFPAMEQALSLAGLTLAEIDLIEFMEAFAATPLKFYRDYEPDPDKVNVNGGHLAMGHPMGATGAILLTTLVHELERRDATTGLVVAAAGSGIGAAMVIERV
jgi:acetyl-CoA acetyltransferase family protein